MNPATPKKLDVDADVTGDGLEIIVNGDRFPIHYPPEVWRRYPRALREILKENIAYSSTLFLPQMIGLTDITYRTNRPLCETFLFKNGIYDMPAAAHEDGASSREYVCEFFNTQPHFKSNTIGKPETVHFVSKRARPQRAVIPFSFGKESLLSFAVAKELGIEPILVLFEEPSHTYEHMHKERLRAAFERETGTKVHVVRYGPGILRYGKYFGLQTELGWGLQATEYALLCLPFVHAYEADIIVVGSEQDCSDAVVDREGMLMHPGAYDQSREWTAQQGMLATLLLGQPVAMSSFVEPLYELSIMRILDRRYPSIIRFLMSCPASGNAARTRRWCQSCQKCGRLFLYCCACGIDPKKVGFTENLFDEEHATVFIHFFECHLQNAAHRSMEDEFILAFLLAERRGYDGETIRRFRRELLPRFCGEEERLMSLFFGIAPDKNVPEIIRPHLLAIYREELSHVERDPAAACVV